MVNLINFSALLSQIREPLYIQASIGSINDFYDFIIRI
jgi:hypothetical protein